MDREQVREQMRRLIRQAWVAYCHEIGAETPNGLPQYDRMSAEEREGIGRHLLALIDKHWKREGD